MMTYDITLRGLKRNQVMDIVDALPKGIVFHCHRNEPEPEAKPNGTKRAARDGDILSMTGKTPQKGSTRQKVITAFEKLEVKHGVGNVTRKMFRDWCKSKGQDSQIIYQLINDGYLKVIGEAK